MKLLTGIQTLLTMPDDPSKQASAEASIGLIHDAAILTDGAGRVAWVGPAADVPAALAAGATVENLSTSAGNTLVMPGLVDPHTHIVYAGDRTGDFELRLAGATYAEIAASGGGIRRTVAATRAASPEMLVSAGRIRLKRLLAHGCTTVEVKSGYGLERATEIRQLEAIRTLADEGPVRIVATCLAAHMVPDEFATNRDGYVALVCDILREVAERGLARFVDVYCDVGAFTVAESVAVLTAGRALGLTPRIHAEQITHTGSAAAAAELGASSADHIEHIDAEGIAAMAAGGTVGILLPTASVFLGDAARPPVRALVNAGVRLALGTDCNPGTSPTTNLWLVANLGCCWYGLTPHLALRAITVEAARALALTDGTGQLVVGGPADFVVCETASWRHLVYDMGHNPVVQTWIGGRRAYSRLPDCC
ncbi:MAG: imidazolonepropionase [Myxococcota bacterium]|jgi:imidazolonepropionase